MNVQDEIKALKERIAELEEQAKQEQKFPQFREDYWFVDEDVELMKTLWHGNFYDHKRLSIGNVFKTKEQAEFAVEKLKVEAELRKFSGHFENGKSDIEIYYYHEFDGIMLNSLKSSQTQGTIYFESEEKAKEAIQSVGEYRIKKYIFGVED